MLDYCGGERLKLLKLSTRFAAIIALGALRSGDSAAIPYQQIPPLSRQNGSMTATASNESI
jgi:hypothetical protein